MADVTKYYRGGGVVSWKPTGGAYAEMGNAPSFSFSPSVTKSKHFESQSGLRLVDFTTETAREGTLTVELEEITSTNLALFMLASEGTGAAYDIMGATAITGSIKFVGAAAATGDAFEIEFPNVSLTPTGEFDFVGEELQSITLEFECLVETGTTRFGTFTNTTTSG